MAKINTVFGLTDNVSSPLEKINASVNRTNKGFTDFATKIFNVNQAIQLFQGVSNIFKRVESTIGGMTSSYQYQSEQELKLTTIMKQRMSATSGMIQSVKDLASAEQKRGIYGDEMILQGAQELASFTQTEGALKTLIPAMNDLIAQQYGYSASGMDFQHTADMMGKVLSGQTGALSRMGYVFSEEEKQLLKTGDEMQRASTLAKIITDNVGHMNQALAGTQTGSIQNINNQLGDMKETIGGILQPLQGAFSRLKGSSTMRLYEYMIPIIQKVVDKSIFMIDYINQHMESIIATVTKVRDSVFKVVQNVKNIITPIFNFIVDNLASITSVSVALFVTYITYLTVIKAKSLIAGLAMAKAWIIANAPLTLIMVAIVGIISGLAILYVKFESVARFIGSAFGVTFAVIYNGVASIWNTFASLAEFLSNLFNDPLGSIGRLFSQLVDNILNLFIPVIEMLDRVTGKNWASNIRQAQEEARKTSEVLYGSSKIQVQRMQMKSIIEYSDKGADKSSEIRDKLLAGTEKIQQIIDELKKGNLSSLQAQSMIDDISDTLDGTLDVQDKSTVNIADDYRDLLSKKASMSFGAHLETALGMKKTEIPQINISGVTISSDVDADNFFRELSYQFKLAVDSALK